jgi:hypothetical protein
LFSPDPTSTCPKRGRLDSYRAGRGSTPAHPPRLFLHSGNREYVLNAILALGPGREGERSG